MYSISLTGPVWVKQHTEGSVPYIFQNTWDIKRVLICRWKDEITLAIFGKFLVKPFLNTDRYKNHLKMTNLRLFHMVVLKQNKFKEIKPYSI